MKPIILVAAVAAFELSFLASIATPPPPTPEAVSALRSQDAGQDSLAQRVGDPVPCTPRG
jgi:hypothetical protein